MGGGSVIDHLPNKSEALCLVSSPMKTSGEWREREESTERRKGRGEEGERMGREKKGKRKSEEWGKGGKEAHI